MKFNHLILAIMIAIFMLITVSAQEVHKQNTEVNLTGSCIFNGGACTSGACKLTITKPDGSFLIQGVNMTDAGNGDFVYNVSFPDLGTYSTKQECSQSGLNNTQDSEVEITVTGQLLNSSKSILYIALMVIAFIILIICLALGITIPSKNNSDEMTGYIVSLNNMKYVKMISWGVAYLVLMLIIYLAQTISMIYLDIDFLGGLFKFGFYSMLVALVPLFIFFVYIIIANAVRDAKLADALSGGLRMRE